MKTISDYRPMRCIDIGLAPWNWQFWLVFGPAFAGAKWLLQNYEARPAPLGSKPRPTPQGQRAGPPWDWRRKKTPVLAIPWSEVVSSGAHSPHGVRPPIDGTRCKNHRYCCRRTNWNDPASC